MKKLSGNREPFIMSNNCREELSKLLMVIYAVLVKSKKAKNLLCFGV